jgi:hypothetical protein
MDRQLFVRINDFAGEMLKGERTGKYTPIETAQWIEDYAEAASSYLKQAEAKTKDKNTPEFRRMAIDVAMQVLLGRFFGAKFRAGVLYALSEQSGNGAALDEALKAYRRARGYWAELAAIAKDVYKPDITVGERPHLRGHWLDRLPAMDEDITFMAKKIDQPKAINVSNSGLVNAAVQEVLGRPKRLICSCRHNQPKSFSNNQPINLELSVDEMPQKVRLYYRHVNQGERYQTAEMQAAGKTFRAIIPQAYTNPKYPIEYYFELVEGLGLATLFPGFNPELNNQPYFVVRQV